MGIISLIFGQWQRLLVYGLLVLAVVGLLVGYGYHKGSQRLFEYQAEQARESARIVVKRAEATQKVVIRYIKVAGETKVVTETIEKETVRYAETNPGHCLDAGWRRLHDSAALNAVPGPAGRTDGEGGAPQAATALQAVTANYAACHRTADRLDALQQWARSQAAVN